MRSFQVLYSVRGLFALAFVVHHSHVLHSVTELAFFKSVHYLVLLFFAYSGFVLCPRYANALTCTQQLRQFMISRTCRVYPLHLLMLLVFVGFEAVKLILERRGIMLNNASFSGDRAPGEILPNLLLIQAWWPGANPLSFNYPSWYVSVEYYVYLLFGLIALALPAQANKVFIVIAVCALLALALGGSPLSDNVLRGVGCFFAGGVTYRLYERLQGLRLGFWLGSVLEVLVLALVYGVMRYSAQDALLSVLFCVAIGIFAFEAGVVSRLLRKRAFVWLGKRWFSIYMTHAAVLFVTMIGVMIVGKATGLPLMVDVSGVRTISLGSALFDNLLVAAEIVVVLAVSMFTYRYVERPGVALGRRWNSFMPETTSL
ncbi:acyltransferase family protein [Pseudomonas sp. NA-150]|uniref:acyltransferase family protein n=1 Tax=Pseudomonas sp. NA-150 TaxID=3367525 RepID=UPI0037CBAF97